MRLARKYSQNAIESSSNSKKDVFNDRLHWLINTAGYRDENAERYVSTDEIDWNQWLNVFRIQEERVQYVVLRTTLWTLNMVNDDSTWEMTE